VGSRRREEAVAAAERTCPRCGAAREADQEYCIECGLRLPLVSGRLAVLRRRWLRRVGWYPGDWVWVSLLTLATAAAGAVVAIRLTDDSGATGATTLVASGPVPIAPARTPRAGLTPGASAAVPEPTLGVTTPGSTGSRQSTAPTVPNGRLTWPEDRNGWTIVLISYPARAGRAAPLETASRAASLGLPEVGVLTSSDFPSLHPGYYVVFSGLYSSRADAEAALTSAHATGFGGAYTRQISR
jgi:hypothetical protein